MKKLLFYTNFLLIAFVVSMAMHTQANAQQKESYGSTSGSGSENTPSGSAATPSSGTATGKEARDGAYDKITTKQKQILPYDNLREADIFWQKRVWRVIDTKQKMNLALMYPKQPLISTMLEIIKNNSDKVRIYMDDEFKNVITLADINSRLGSVDTVTVIDPETYAETKKIVSNDFDWTTVSKFRVKEDWMFDKEASNMIVRILAIAPIRDVIDDNGNYRGQEAMFYAYYPDFRPYLIKYEVFNPGNDAQALTWDDIFEMRYFASFIMKESNMQDRRIQEYASGRDALMESERVKNNIFEKEHSLWSY